jgi:predicted CXXCH cytochrome family protein
MLIGKRAAVVLWILALVAAAMIGCGSDDDGSTDEPGPFPGGFLGLANVEQNVTQCGECHPSQQANWVETAHAHAFETLAMIGREGPEQSCAPCHNISDRGNTVDDPSLGFVMTGNSHLRNVQCENCHGPGSDHLANPSIEPVAPIAVNFDVGCGECHQDAHHPFVDEWLDSAHAGSHLSAGGRVATDPNCAYCHVTQSFVEFVRSGDRVIPANPEPLTCVACHDPHGNGAEKQLRQIEGEPIVCAFCHNSGDATIGDTPHHPQASVLLATAGFFFDGVDNPGPATHGNLDNNPDLCAACHVVTVPFMRQGDLQIPAQVGHTFRPIPIIDEMTGARNYENCVECHSNPASIRDAWIEKFEELVDELGTALDAVPEGQRETEAYQGALFNFQLLEADSSEGVHNPRLAETLLESSIEALQGL